MKHVIFSVLLVGLCSLAYGQSAREVAASKTLVAYFSCSGNTAQVAKTLAEATQGTLFEIKAAQPYTAADLDYRNRQCRSIVEMGDAKARPAIAAKVEQWSSFSTVYIGFPIWCDAAPRIINTFLESYDFSGKTVIPFVTSGSSPIDHSASALKTTYPQISWKQGMRLNNMTAEQIKTWTGSLASGQ